MPDLKITTKQAIMLVVTVIVSHTIVTLPATLLQETKSATILNLIYVSILALILVYLICKLFKKFQGQDIIDISEYLGGPFFKNVIGTIFIVYFLSSSGIILRNFAEGLKVIYFPNTNIAFIILAFIVTICYTNTLHFSSNAKAVSIILPIVIISIIFLFIGNIQNFSLQRALPILGDGVYNTFIAGIGNIVAFGGISCLYFIPPLLKEPEKMKKIAITSILVCAFYLLLCTSTILFMFSFFDTVDEILPLYTAASYIEFGTFFQRLDAIFLLIWVLEICCYLSIACHFSMFTFKKITKIKYLKPLAFIFPLFIFGITLLPKTIADSRFIGDIVYKYIILAVVFLLSFAILIFANIRKKKEGVQNQEQD